MQHTQTFKFWIGQKVKLIDGKGEGNVRQIVINDAGIFYGVMISGFVKHHIEENLIDFDL